ncbi:MAG: hypothetical protein R3296_11075 [Oleiphilaceae bacterium]|nr:hypothetical protein [Oleiphilaceae bacterium]
MYRKAFFTPMLLLALMSGPPAALGYGGAGETTRQERSGHGQLQQNPPRQGVSQPSLQLRQQQSVQPRQQQQPQAQRGMRPGQSPASQRPGMGRGPQPGARQPSVGAAVDPANQTMEEARKQAEQQAGPPPEYLGDD